MACDAEGEWCVTWSVCGVWRGRRVVHDVEGV